MIPMNPQHLADMFGLFFFQVGNMWYGCRNEPQWVDGTFCYWDAGVELVMRRQDVLYIGLDRDSLFRPASKDISKAPRKRYVLYCGAEHGWVGERGADGMPTICSDRDGARKFTDERKAMEAIEEFPSWWRPHFRLEEYTKGTPKHSW